MNENRPVISRRYLLKAGIAGGTAVAASAIPFSGAFGAQRPTELAIPLTADQRIAETRRTLVEIRRAHPTMLPAISAETAAALRGHTSFNAGEKVDRGNPNQKVVYVRVDDFWWEQQGNDYLDTVEELGIPVTALPVGQAVLAFPDLIKRADALKTNGKKLVEWGNHTDDHSPLDQLSTTGIMQRTLPQNHALENTLLIEENSLFMGPPYGAGALPGEPTDGEIVEAGKRMRAGILGWSLDTESYNGKTIEEIVNKVLNGVRKGFIIITHPVEEGTETEAMRIWVPTLRNRGWRIGRLSELSHPGVGA